MNNPFPEPDRPYIDLKVSEAKSQDIRRGKIRIMNEVMKQIGVSTGEIVEIHGNHSTASVAWPAYPEDLNRKIIRMDNITRENAGIALGDKVRIFKSHPKKAKKVSLSPAEINLSFEFGFENFIKRKLLGYPLTLGDTVLIPVLGKENPFVIQEVQPEGVVLITDATKVEVISTTKDDSENGYDKILYDDIGGLGDVIQKIREMVELPLKHPEIFEALGIDAPKGVLLHGPPGVGKTLIARAVAYETSAHFITINGPEIISKYYGESEQRLRSIFREAEDQSPSIIFIDEIDAIAPKRDETGGDVEKRVVAQLLASMDGMVTKAPIVIIAATNRLEAVDNALRRPGRFDREIEIGVPSKEARLEILQIHTRRMPLEESVDLKYYAKTLHGMVGSDLQALAREAGMRTMRRFLPEIDLEADTIPEEILDRMKVTNEDFLDASREVQPSALREVYIELPDVSFDDIGGLDDIIDELKETVEWPLTRPEVFTKMGITPPTGILLYGPQGTGKTLLAKAIASSAEANFISIKGPELLSKWVGESEKAIREIFRKAKVASPTIVFFDEIDSIASNRGSRGESGVTERVISQLLTEIDGMEERNNIIVMASTNRPDMVDPALLRPGRFDRIIHVHAPNVAGRMKILEIYTDRMPLAKDVNLKEIAKTLDGFVGSDIEALCREAGIMALREDIMAKIVNADHFDQAGKKVYPTMSTSAEEYYTKIEATLRAKDKTQGRKDNQNYT